MNRVAFAFFFFLFPLLSVSVLPAQDDNQGPPPDQGAPAGPEGSPDQANDQAASFQTFYDQLGSQGNWVQTDNYGYVWQPNESDPNWRPYSDGHWIYTDDGWTWAADDSEPWGWATYHYGRWADIDGEGWVWVPGYTWAPAWVSWRYGGGYCGWAPLPPETSIGIDFFGGGAAFGFDFHIGGDCDTAYGIGPGYYNFLPVGYIGRRNYRGFYANRNNNFGLIGRTTNVTNVNVANGRGGNRAAFGRVTTGGPSFATLAAQSHEPIQRATLTSSSRVGNPALRGNSLAVYAPRISTSSTAALRPSRVAGTLTNAQVNRGTDINRPLAVNSRIRAAAPTSEQVAAARQAQLTTSSRARVATAASTLPRALSRPLTAFQPRTETPAQGNANRSAVKTEVAHRAAVSSGLGTASTEVHHRDRAAESSEAAPSVRQANEDAAFTGDRNGATDRATHSSTAASERETGESRAEREATGEAPTYHAQEKSETEPSREPSFHSASTEHSSGGSSHAGEAPHAAASHDGGGHSGGGDKGHSGGGDKKK